jgi:hypothetical protein
MEAAELWRRLGLCHSIVVMRRELGIIKRDACIQSKQNAGRNESKESVMMYNRRVVEGTRIECQEG